jgi:YD repeat-containing protein
MNKRSNKEYCVWGWDPLSEYDLVQYTLYSIWSKLASKTETEYYDSGISTVTTNYYYDNPTHALLSRENFIDSRGDTIKKKYYYPQDYDTTGFSNLIGKFITGKPIDTRTYINSKITSCVQNKYNNYGQITDFYKGEITNTTADIPFNKSSAYTATHRAGYSYNANKNLISISPDNDAKTSFIWGYGNTLPVAKVVNASGSEIAYSGFEDKITTGNWNLSSASFYYLSGSAARGKNYIRWNSGAIISPSLNSSTKYRLRFYAKSNGSCLVTLTGIGAISISGDNQWHLYESAFQSQTSLTLTPSSAIFLDEITLCPQSAMMTTYIYDPLIGIRSYTDENEVTTYYEYDTFGRLIRIKDQNGNVLKEYKYNYANN